MEILCLWFVIHNDKAKDCLSSQTVELYVSNSLIILSSLLTELSRFSNRVDNPESILAAFDVWCVLVSTISRLKNVQLDLQIAFEKIVESYEQVQHVIKDKFIALLGTYYTASMSHLTHEPIDRTITTAACGNNLEDFDED